jgi:hypothetical protein
MPTVLWRGWSHGKEWFDSPRRGSPLVPFEVRSSISRMGSYEAGRNEVGVLNCTVSGFRFRDLGVAP